MGVGDAALHRPIERTVYTCALDDTPAHWASFAVWLATALGPGGIDARDIVAHHVAPLPPDIQALCETHRLRTVAIAPFDSRSAQCNKIRQCETDFGDARRVVMIDVATVFSGRLPLHALDAPVAGTSADPANPPLSILRGVFGAAGLRIPDARTHLDSGLYVFDARACRDTIGPRWSHWARWLLERAGLLERWRAQVDQVALWLALAECGMQVQALPDLERILLRHHGKLDAHMCVDANAIEHAGEALVIANAAIERFQHERFDNRTYWNHRYAAHPELGSGPASRGEALADKRAWLSALTSHAPGMSVLDWGCGDLEVARTLPCGDGTGVDVSVEALRLARSKRPDWRFLTPVQFDALDGRPRDLVLCLDVLIHQRRYDEYALMLHRLGPLARLGLLVAGYDAAPRSRSHVTWFHEPLRTTLAAMPHVVEAIPLMERGDTTLYFAATSEAGRALAHRVMDARVA
ncbi:class I SAM-dependent methyltransferase [Noviluteimonas gilva]|uniref:Methyltransferase domain-containing protein n=1 Tax=Noviluteimonas gilva TaxID=2682097 RepID=A0A7C9HRQ6_9GAMM|nr:class I SAM-dependent methyltransferase [Lysobacter gilvus]MUV13791.1 hypothetical protein [Lysobacter gilvus]